jgi:hypothetical protein
MSADDAANGWALTLACNRCDAEAMPEIGEVFPDLVDPPTLNVEEPDPDQPDAWVMTAYFADEPDAALVARIMALFPSATDMQVAPLPDADWTTLSQRNLEPVRAGSADAAAFATSPIWVPVPACWRSARPGAGARRKPLPAISIRFRWR